MYMDFHFFGTYVAACYAGYSAKEAQIIAHAAQYVDDSINSRLIKGKDYDIDFQPIPTCHTTGELGWTPVGSGPSQLEVHQVWIPFHFLPGNYISKILPDPNASSRMREYKVPKQDSSFFSDWNYDERSKWEFKLLCLPESPISIAMINDIINKHKGQPYELHLIGLRMHVLADTAAHAYYAGTPAWHINDVGAKVYDLTARQKTEVKWSFVGGEGIEQCTPNTTIYNDSIFYLGHGRMGSLPDYPWIRYEYTPQWSSTPVVKDNPTEYLKIFRVMVTALKCIREQKTFDANSLESIDKKYLSVIESILKTKHDFGLGGKATDIRCLAWIKEIQKGSLGSSVCMPEKYDEDAWYYTAIKQKPIITQTDYYKFNKAAIIHLNFVKNCLRMDGIINDIFFYNNCDMAFIANNDSNDLLVVNSGDCPSWSISKKAGQSNMGTPALAVFNNKLWMAFVANNSNKLSVVNSDDGYFWSVNQDIRQESKATPALAVFNNKLWMAFVANNKSNELLVVHSDDGLKWLPENKIDIGQASKATPAFAVFNNKLWIAFVARDNNDLLAICSDDGLKWLPENQIKIGQESKATPALAVFNNKLWMAFVANNKSNDLLAICSDNGLKWLPENQIKIGQESKATPALTVINNTLWMAFVANNESNDLLAICSDDGLKWLPENQIKIGVSFLSNWYYILSPSFIWLNLYPLIPLIPSII